MYDTQWHVCFSCLIYEDTLSIIGTACSVRWRACACVRACARSLPRSAAIKLEVPRSSVILVGHSGSLHCGER